MMNNTFLFDLNETMTLAQAGGKGVNLHELIEAGFAVPDGFVIGTAVYQSFVQTNQLEQVITTATQNIPAGDLAAFEAASAAIRTAFEQGDIPPDAAAAITQAYVNLGENCAVAVRSSAIAEDLPEASFAGQQETYLNVKGEEALLTAVRRCWSSLWTARAIAYRAQQGIAEAALAVVVQEMIMAEAAGVLFTLNPVTGNRDEVMINATWGLGEALVSGQVNPDTFVVDKATGQIKQVEIGEKAVMTAVTAHGTTEIEVGESQRQQQAITARHATKLTRTAAAIEQHFGNPQDIEWAIARGEVFILQSRPVTAVATAPITLDTPPPGDDAWPPVIGHEPQPFDRWSQMDVGERWPEPVSPLTWSVWYDVTQKSTNAGDAMVALQAEPYMAKIHWMRRQYGRIYFNEGAMLHTFTQGYGLPASLMADSLGTQGEIAPEADRWQLSKLLRRGHILIKMQRKWQQDIARFEAMFHDIDRWVDEFMQQDLRQLSDQEIWNLTRGIWYERMMTGLNYHIEMTSQSATSFAQLEKQMAKLGDKQLAYRLTTGISGIITAEIVPTLWRIAEQLDKAGLTQLILNHEPLAALHLLRQSEAARPALATLDQFLQRHGHRCMTEAEWIYPRWIEAPEQVIESIAGYLRAGLEHNPADMEARQRQAQEAATAQVEAQLNPISRALFRRNLARTHHLIRMRDNGQHYLVKLVMPVRVMYAELGRRWAERGWLMKANDFPFLVLAEMAALVQTADPVKANLNLPAVVAARRQAYEHWFRVSAPEVLDAEGREVQTAVTHDDPHTLNGVPASSGKVTGVARVIMTPREATTLQPGDILITRATDPGWTPVFSVIGGLVLEVGGQLSHGAIVAREYGLPAVVNVPAATQLIQDGQTVTVDGSAGKVKLAD